MKTENLEFKVLVPIDITSSIEKTDSTTDGKWYIRGYASTPNIDLHGEVVQPQGINIDHFINHGWINYEHKQDAKYVVGSPTENSYVDVEKGLYVEAVLFKDNPYAQEMWSLAQQIHKTGVDRNLGFSIEGYVKKRNELDKNIIESVEVRNVAITKNPANPNSTWESFIEKAFTAGHEIDPAKQTGGSALKREELAQAITTLTWAYKHPNKEEVHSVWKEVAERLDYAGKSDYTTTLLMLQLSKGLSIQEAKSFLKGIEEPRGEN